MVVKNITRRTGPPIPPPRNSPTDTSKKAGNWYSVGVLWEHRWTSVFTSTFGDGPTASIWSMKWVVASDHQLPILPLSQEIANNGVRGMNWLQNWIHDFDSLSSLHRLGAAFSDSNHGSSRDDCSARATFCRKVWTSSKRAWNRISTLSLIEVCP